MRRYEGLPSPHRNGGIDGQAHAIVLLAGAKDALTRDGKLGTGIITTAKRLGLGNGTVNRIRREMGGVVMAPIS